MSFTQHASTATCTLSVNTVDEAVTLLTDWLGNNPDEFPDSLSEDGAESEIADELSPYISRDESGQIIVSVDSESDDGNYSSDVFDFITSHFAEIQTSEYMTVTWSCFLSRDGMSSGTDYYDQDGKYFYISSKSKDSKALDSIAHILSGKSWTSEDMELICEVVRDTGRVISDIE
jgi:hypothetical protein